MWSGQGHFRTIAFSGNFILIFVFSILQSIVLFGFNSTKRKLFFPWNLRGTPGTKSMNVIFSGLKLKNMIRVECLLKCDSNNWVLTGTAKWPYPPSSFVNNLKYYDVFVTIYLLGVYKIVISLKWRRFATVSFNLSWDKSCIYAYIDIWSEGQI